MAVPLFAPRRPQPAGVPAVASPAADRKGAAAPKRLGHGYAREAAALVLLASALFAALALASFRGDPMRPELTGPDWVGPVGATVARAGVDAIGVAAWLFPIELALMAAPLLNGKPSIAGVTRIAGDVVVVFILAALAEVAFPHVTAFGAMPFGGCIGELFGEVLRTLFSTVGSYIIGLTIVGLILVGRATFSFIDWVKRIERTLVRMADRVAAAVRALFGAWITAREIDKKRDQMTRRVAGPHIAHPNSDDAIIAALTEDDEAGRESSGGDLKIVVAAGSSSPLPSVITEAALPALPLLVAKGAATVVADPDELPAPPKPRRGRRLEAATADSSQDVPPAHKEAPIISREASKEAAPAVSRESSKDATPIAKDVPRDVALPPKDAPAASKEAAPARGGAGEPRIVRRAVMSDPGTSTVPKADVASKADAVPIPPMAEEEEVVSPAPESDRARPLESKATPISSTAEPMPDVDGDEEDMAVSTSSVPSVVEPVDPTPSPAPVTRQSVRPSAGSRGADFSPSKSHSPAPPKAEPMIVDTAPALKVVKADKPRVVPAIGDGFRLPQFEMLDPAGADLPPIDEEHLQAMAQLLEKTLSDYGVSGKVEEIHPGPTVTTFEVSPAAGTKVSKVAGLADDLALGLSRKVRIIAPIVGKNRIGFEIPNVQRVPVNLRELVEDRRFQEMKAPLPCVLGRDIIGAPYFADLSSMPHVIVAGATGAGKSVGLNVMLVSLLFRKTPADLRLLMIDPKVVELAPFDRIPHMLLPVVTDMKQAANALKWAVDEMERRYQLFANAGTKNITTYNGWVERVLRGEARAPKPPARVSAVGVDGLEVEVDAARDGSDAALPEKIPFIVIVVDEFADLMMQQGKDVEASVARLAQKARAAGMHVILATQRPSVDVITGMIKANFPTRIAYRVAQKVDSRTILDEQGAEHLLGRGDMLVKMNGSNETRRVQCPFCSEEEVQRITDFLRLQGEPVYDEAILKARDDEGEEADANEAETDPMYDAAVRIVADTRRCSTSWIQRKLGVGYNRAAKIVEAMEKRGVVGPANGAKDREVLISSI